MTSSAIRVLLIDDEESDFLMTKALLGRIEGPVPEVEWASSSEEGLRLLGERRHDVCLLDYFLQDGTGLELLRRARSQAIRTPIILLTGKGSRAVDLQAMKSGAVDYLVKGSESPESLERSLRYAVERHRAQEALRESEERHRAMFDHLPLGLYRVSAEGEYVEANPALIRMLDYPPREMLGQVHARNYFVSPRDRDQFHRTIREQGVVLGFESELRTGTGRMIRVRNTARVHRGPSGGIEYVEGSVEDVSASRSARSIHAEAAAFRALLASAEVGVLLCDYAGRVSSVNEAGRSALGLPSDSIEGAILWDLFHPQDGVMVAEALERVAGGGADSVSRTVRASSSEDPSAGAHLRVTVLGVTGAPEASDLIVVLVHPLVIAAPA